MKKNAPETIKQFSDRFREELKKVMPGYKWTISKLSYRDHLHAYGILSSGFNRLSTMHVVRDIKTTGIEYSSRLFGFGTRAPLISESSGTTLRQCLRNLQDQCESEKYKWRGAVSYLEHGRKGEL